MVKNILTAYVIGLTEDKFLIEDLIRSLETNQIKIICWLTNQLEIKRDNKNEFEHWNDISHVVVWVTSNKWNNLLESKNVNDKVRRESFLLELGISIERKHYWELHGRKDYVRCYCLTLERLHGSVAELSERFASTRYFNLSNVNSLLTTIIKQQNNMVINKEFKSIKASDLCSKAPETYALNQPLHELFDAFLKRKFRHFPIVDNEHNLTAFLSITDLYHYFPFSNRVYDYLNRRTNNLIDISSIQQAQQEFNIKLRNLFRVTVEEAIKDVNLRSIFQINSNAIMPEIIEKFTTMYNVNGRDRYLRCFPVMDDYKNLVGVLSYVDILKAFKNCSEANDLAVRDIAYIGVVTDLNEGDELGYAKKLLQFSPFRHLPVVGKKIIDAKKGKEIETVVGMIDDYIITHNFKEQIEATSKVPVNAVMDKTVPFDDIIQMKIIPDNIIPQLNGNESIKSLIEYIYMRDDFKTKEGFPICVNNAKIEGMVTYINILTGIKTNTNLLR
jgi:predicted transcriptional regulator